MGIDRPAKAYHVERICRTVTTLKIYAHNAEEAKRRALMGGNVIDSETEGRGFGRVRRAPSDDRKQVLAGGKDQ